jgi:hypothetical protein
MAIELDEAPKKINKGGRRPGDCYPTGHGAFSGNIRARYSDERTAEGRELAAVLGDFVQDLGGEGSLMAGQRVLLANIKSKIIIIKQIGAYIDNKLDIIDDNGELLPCLKGSYSTYSESLRRDIEALYSLAGKRITKQASLQQYLDASYSGADKGKQK